MNRGLWKRLLPLGVLAGALAVAGRTGLCADVWNLPALEDELARQDETGEQLALRGVQVDQRIHAKLQLAHDLADGRRTLADVTAAFYELNRDNAEAYNVLQRLYGTTDRYVLSARNALDFAAAHDYPTPTDRAAALRRLTAEFAHLPGHAP